MNRKAEELKTLYTDEAQALSSRAKQALSEGVRRARVKKTSGALRLIRSVGAAAAAVALSFILMVNAWPAFAAAVENVPVLGELARLVSLDRGLRAAVGNGYYKPMDQSFTLSNGRVKLAFRAFTADESSLALFFHVESPDGSVDLDAVHISTTLFDEAGNEITASGTMGPLDSGGNSSGMWWSDQRFLLDGTTLPEKLTVKTKVYLLNSRGDTPFATYEQEILGEVSFPMDIPESLRLRGETIPLGKTINLPGGEWVELIDLTVNPLRTRLRIRPSSSDLYLRLRLSDERGEEYLCSITSGADGDGIRTCLIESSFFEKGRELYLNIAEYTKPTKGRLITLSIDETGKKPGETGIDWLTPEKVEKVPGGVELWYRVENESGRGYDVFGSPLLDANGVDVREDYEQRMAGYSAFSYSCMEVTDDGTLLGIGIPDGYAFPMTAPLSFGEAVTLEMEPMRLK